MTKRRFGIAALLVATLSHADLAEARLAVIGDPTDLLAFEAIVKNCEGSCEFFQELLEQVEDEPRTVTLLLGRDLLYSQLESDSTGVIGQRILGDVFLGYGSAIVDLDDLEAIPELTRTQDRSGFEFSIESWPVEGSSRCQVLAHVLGENLIATRENIPDHGRCHIYGMECETRVRQAYGQADEVLDRSFGVAGADTQTLRSVIGDTVEEIVFRISSGICTGCVIFPDTASGSE